MPSTGVTTIDPSACPTPQVHPVLDGMIMKSEGLDETFFTPNE